MPKWKEQAVLLEEPKFRQEAIESEEPTHPNFRELAKEISETGANPVQAQQSLQKKQLDETYRGHLSKGWLMTAIGLANIPADFIRTMEESMYAPSPPSYLGGATGLTPMNYVPREKLEKIHKDIGTPTSDFVQNMTGWLTEGAQYYIDKHPEWAGNPPESFIELLKSPKKLSYAITESIPMLVGVGLATAAGHPVAAFSLAYASEGESAAQNCRASGGTRKQQQTMRICYGLPAAALEFAQVNLGLKIAKDVYRAVLSRMGFQVGKQIAKKGAASVTKEFLLGLVTENVQEWTQGTWEEVTSKMIYDAKQEGGWLGFVQRRAMESLVITPLVVGTGGAGAAVGFMGKGSKTGIQAPQKPIKAPKAEISPVAPIEPTLPVTEREAAPVEKMSFSEQVEYWKKQEREGKISIVELGKKIMEIPSKETAPVSKANQTILDRYESGDIESIEDLITELESQKNISPQISDAINKYKEAVKIDREEYGMRSGLPEQAEENLLNALSQPPAPAAGKATPTEQGIVLPAVEDAIGAAEGQEKQPWEMTREELQSEYKRLYKIEEPTGIDKQREYQVKEAFLKIALAEFDKSLTDIREPWQITTEELKVPGAIKTIPKDSEVGGGVRIAMPSAREKGQWQVSQVSADIVLGKAKPFTHVEFTTKEGALEYLKNIHKIEVKEAIKQEKPVPLEVLEEYSGEKWADEALAKPPSKTEQVIEEPIRRDILGGVEPIQQINKALKEAKKIRPLVESERKAEMKKRVGAAAGSLESAIGKGKPAEESIFRSTGLLKGPLTERRYSSIRDIMEESSPGAIDSAFKSIYDNKDLRFFEVLNTSDAFRKLIDGEPITMREVELIKKHFGIEMAEIAKERADVSPLGDRLIALWKAGLLTGIKTSMLNEMSNLSHGFTETAKDAPAALVDKVASLFTGERTIAFTTKGSLKGAKEGVQKGIDYMRTGYDERGIGKKLDWNRVNFGNSKIAKGLQAYEETIFHLLGAEDQPFYYGAKSRSIYNQAYAKGKNEGLKGDKLDEYADKLVQNPTDNMLEIAAEDAEVAVFQNRTVLGDVAASIQKTRIGQVIVPFGRTPSAVATQIIHYTPAGVVSEIFTEIKKGKFNQRKFSQAFGRATVGTAVLAVGTALYKAGTITLDYPKSERERKLWESEGKKPYAIKIGGKWRSVYVLGPIGNVLLIGGYFQKAYDESGSPSEAMKIALAGGAKSFSEQTFVVGINRVIEAMKDPERSAERFFTSLAGSTVPTIVADIAAATDYAERRYKGIYQGIAKRLPGLRRTLEPRIDVYGQDLPRYGGNPLEVMIDATRPAKIKQDTVVDEIRRLWDNDIKVAPTQLGNREGYEILTPKENTLLWRRSGNLLYKRLYEMFNSNVYKKLDDEGKGKLIEKVTKISTDFARAEAAMVKMNQGKTVKELKEDGLITNDVLKYIAGMR